ncbi:hypothetical protein YC2023_051426 [Brassica napus]
MNSSTAGFETQRASPTDFKERQSLKSQARHSEEEERCQIGVVSTSYGSNSLTVLSFDLMYTDLLETSPVTTSSPTQLALDLR